MRPFGKLILISTLAFSAFASPPAMAGVNEDLANSAFAACTRGFPSAKQARVNFKKQGFRREDTGGAFTVYSANGSRVFAGLKGNRKLAGCFVAIDKLRGKAAISLGKTLMRKYLKGTPKTAPNESGIIAQWKGLKLQGENVEMAVTKPQAFGDFFKGSMIVFILK